MRKLLFITPLLLMGCTNHGGGFGAPSGWSYMDTGGAGEYTCENTSFHDHYCATGEHPNLCDC